MADWMNDHEINQFLNAGAYPLTIDDEVSFVESVNKDKTGVVLGIWHRKNQKLIGNTGFHQVHQLHQTASFGIVIGEKKYHRCGIGTEVVELMLSYAFSIRNLRNVTLSVLGNNPGAKRCYEKCGYVDIGTYPKHIYKAGAWHDEHLMIAHNPLYA